MSGIFQFAVRTQTELEAKMTSVERVAYYAEVLYVVRHHVIILLSIFKPITIWRVMILERRPIGHQPDASVFAMLSLCPLR
jgi:hypothetical protein